MSPAFIDNMMYVGDTPWHKQGIRVQDAPTIEEALQYAKLGWKVNKRKTYYFDNNIHTQAMPTGGYCTYRADTGQVLGKGVSERYGVLQNEEAFAPFEPLLDMGFKLETAGSVQDGRKVWILAKSPERYTVGNDDVIDQYVLLYTSHDGSAGSVFRPTGVRVVCYNTIELALSKQAKWNYSLKHTSSIKERVKNLTNIIARSNGDFKTAINDMNNFNEVEMNKDSLDLYLETVIPFLKDRNKESKPDMDIFVRNTALPVYNKIKDNFYNGIGNKGETLWDAYNAITQYYTHDKQYKDWVRTTQFGAGYDYNVKAFKIAQKFVNVTKKQQHISLN